MRRLFWLIIFLLLIVGIVIFIYSQSREKPQVQGQAVKYPPSFENSLIYLGQLAEKTELFALNLENQKISQLTTDSQLKGLPTLAPDYQRLAYWQEQDDNYLIKVLDLKAGATSSISLAKVKPNFLAFSPDGKKLIYLQPTASLILSGQTLFLYDFNNNSTSEIAPNVTFASWSQDSLKIIFTQVSGQESSEQWVIIQTLGADSKLVKKEKFFQAGQEPWFYQLDAQVVMVGSIEGKSEIISKSLALEAPVKVLTNLAQLGKVNIQQLQLNLQRDKILFQTTVDEITTAWVLYLDSNRLQKLTENSQQAVWCQDGLSVLSLDQSGQLLRLELGGQETKLVSQLTEAKELVSSYLSGGPQAINMTGTEADQGLSLTVKEFLPSGDEYLLSITGVVRPAQRSDTLVLSKIKATDKYRFTIFDSSDQRIYENDQILVTPDKIETVPFKEDLYNSFYLVFSVTPEDSYYLRWDGEEFQISK